ncbi:MAG: ATP-binding protein [Pseudobdellovibrio sp.]
MTIKIAVTGGPSGGKTTLIEALKKEFGSKVKIVPEAASILYKGGFPRLKNYSGYFHAQKAIYSTQQELEGLSVDNFPEALIVCDRGSLDSLAYWPDTAEHFFKTFNTTRAVELARYTWILHLDTAQEIDYDTSYAIRIEDFHEALMINDKIKKSWEGHPQRFIISAAHDFISKMNTSTNIIRAILAGKSYENILKTLT